jgi:UDP-N-acetylglucosamine 4,6-dehydratase
MEILITGGTGSLGLTLTSRLIESGHSVRILSRNPLKQLRFSHLFPGVKLFLSDICDFNTLCRAADGCDAVVHAAALKHVSEGQRAPVEYVRVNVSGTLSVACAVVEMKVPQALLISTDKAVEPINLYGKTKAVAEDLWLAHRRDYSPQFGVLRYGNVIDSEGSVLLVWAERAMRGQPLVVRLPEPTRYLFTSETASRLAHDLITGQFLPPIAIPSDLRSFSLTDLAAAIQDPEKWIEAPLMPGEKRHESLVARDEMAVEFVNGDFFQIKKDLDWGEGMRRSSSEDARRVSAEEVLKEAIGAMQWRSSRKLAQTGEYLNFLSGRITASP